MYNKTLSLWLIGVSAFIGLAGMVLTQITIPELFRKPGWMYEKDYFEFTDWRTKKSLSSLVKVSKKSNPNKQKAKEEKALAKLKKIEEKTK